MSRPLIAVLAAAALALPATAQRADAPLGEILEALQDPERPAAREPAREPPSRRAPLPPSGIAPTALPPSQAQMPLPAEAAENETFIDETAEPLNPWEAERERRRAEVNAQEAPVTGRLNESITARHEAIRRANTEAEAAHSRALAERETEIGRRAEAHRAALERHAADVARQRADYEHRVAACLAGDLAYCDQSQLPRRR